MYYGIFFCGGVAVNRRDVMKGVDHISNGLTVVFISNANSVIEEHKAKWLS